MKSETGKAFLLALLLVAILLLASPLHAQLQLSSSDLSAIESTTPIPADELPLIGTFYSAANPSYPPMPGNILGLPGWNLGNGYYLLDDLNGKGSSGALRVMDDSEPPIPGSGGGGTNGVSSYAPTPSLPTNGLWLQITNISEGSVYANLNGATDFVYAIFSVTNLTSDSGFSSSNVETEVFPGTSTNTVPFTVSMNGRNALFLSAIDWTGVTANDNQTPLWWLYYWFGAAGLNLSDSDLDPYGDTIHYDYVNKLDPNPIEFSVVVNHYANTNLVPMQLSISAGNPGSIALVDSANFIPEGETLYPYTSSNIIANLDPVEGQHDIWIGLKGSQTNAVVTWEEAVVTLNTNAPVIAVTNLVSNVVCQPLIQVQGLINEQLSSLTFDVSNAQQILTNQTGYTGEPFFDTNSLEFTTNAFQLYDIRLTNGLNTITIHATDLAGNETTTNLSVTLDFSGDTNPPALNIEWPSNGSVIGGNNFTLQAQVDDITATVTAIANGQTNTGIVQRNGQVRGLTLPLSGGTNIVTVTATDAAGNSTTTNLTMVQSAVTLTINPISSDQLNQPSVYVTGTVSDPNAAVTVNGVSAGVDTNGNWNATVLVSPTGVATIEATASDSSDAATMDATAGGSPNSPVISQDLEQPQPPILEAQSMNSYFLNWTDVHLTEDGSCWVPKIVEQNEQNWVNGIGGENNDESQSHDDHCGDPIETSTSTTPLSTNYYSNEASWEYDDDFESATLPGGNLTAIRSQEDFHLIVDTGGEGQPGTLQAFAVLAGASYSDSYESIDSPSPAPPEASSLFGRQFQNCGIVNPDGMTNGLVFVKIPAGATLPNFMPSASYKFYYPELQLTNLTLEIVDTNTGNVLSGQTNTVIVGQQMSLSCQLNITNATLNNSALTDIHWTVPGDAISNYVFAPDSSSAIVETNFPTTNSSVEFYWVDGATNRVLQCSAMIDGEIVSNQATFNINRPAPQFSAQVVGTIAADTNYHNYAFDANIGNVDDLGLKGGWFLHFGIDSSWTNVGIAFSYSNAPTIWPTATPYGRYFLVQIINNSDNKKNVFLGTNLFGLELTQHGLDVAYPYQSQYDLWHIGGYSYRTNDSWFDSPASELDGSTWLSRTDSFTMYLMFEPSYPSYASNIPVPMYSAAWTWGGVAETNSSDGFSLISSSSPSPTVFPTVSFPTWNVISTNFFQYQTNTMPFNEN